MEPTLAVMKNCSGSAPQDGLKQFFAFLLVALGQLWATDEKYSSLLTPGWHWSDLAGKSSNHHLAWDSGRFSLGLFYYLLAANSRAGRRRLAYQSVMVFNYTDR